MFGSQSSGEPVPPIDPYWPMLGPGRATGSPAAVLRALADAERTAAARPPDVRDVARPGIVMLLAMYPT